MHATYKIASQHDWTEMLTDTITGFYTVGPSSYLYLIVRPSGDSIPVLIQFGNPEISTACS